MLGICQVLFRVTTVRNSDVLNYFFLVNFQGEVLFNSWKDMFNGDGGFLSQQARIYSFSGQNILTDFVW
jgi:hypothetical protein